MKVLYAKCDNGHFFDANKDEECPKCGSNVYTLLGEKKQKKNGSREDAKEKKEEEKLRRLGGKKEKKEDKYRAEEVRADSGAKEKPGTYEQKDNSIASDESAITSDYAADENKAQVDKKKDDKKPSVVRLQGYTGMAQENEDNEDNKTIRFWDKEDTQLEPVVGWLVCIKGAEAGRSYTLKTGANRVGRLEAVNDVVLAKDERVSRSEHIVITFEPKHCKFYIQSGTGRSLAYLNGALLCDSAVLNERDSIELGGSTLVFVPLCGSGFDWNTSTGAQRARK